MSELDGHHIYEAVLRLGTSSCGNATTIVARHKLTKELVSIKLIRRGWDKVASKALSSSSFTHMELSLSMHPHIVEFKEAFLLPRHLAIVMEYVEGETLELFLERVGGHCIENLARFIFQQLIIAVDFCHKKGKLLRDIKPSTILLHISEGTLPLLKLWDFASSKDIAKAGQAPSVEEEDQSGSALFVAPEVIMPLDDETISVDERAADLYACGVILYICIYGSHPFLRDSDPSSDLEKVMAMFQRVLDGEVEFPTTLPPQTISSHGTTPQAQALSVSNQCIELIKGLLNPDPALRLTSDKIFANPWFKDSLPNGADVMNSLLMEGECCIMLSPAQVATFLSLVKKASVDDGSCVDSISPSGQSPQSSGGDVLSSGGSPSNTAGNINSGGVSPVGRSGPPLLGRSGPSLLGRRIDTLESQMSLQPLESMSGLSDALMRIPTGMLLRAAVEDMKSESPRKMDLKQFPSMVAPRSPSSLEKALLTSPAFVKEMREFGPAEALRQTQMILGIAPGSSLVTRLASLNASDLAAIMSSIDGRFGATAFAGPSTTAAASPAASPAATTTPRRLGKRRVRDKSRFGNEADVSDQPSPRLDNLSLQALPEDVSAANEAVLAAATEAVLQQYCSSTAATEAVLAALNDMGEICPASSLQFPWIEGPEMVPLASISAMDVSFDWGAQPTGQQGGLMESPWAMICNSAASQHAMKKLKHMGV